MKRWSRLDWLIIIIFAGLVVLFYWRILTPDLDDRQSFPPGDFSAQFWAFATFEMRELSAGRLPLWNPYTFAGSPFWADVQAAVFYPPSLLTLLLSAPWGFSLFALEVEAIAHFWLAATFMYLFIRQITHSRAAAVIAALTFTFSGYLTGYPSQQLAVLEADVWLPLILFFIYRANERMANRRTHRAGVANGERRTRRASAANTLPSTGQPASQPTNQLTDQTSPLPPLLLAGAAWGMTLLAGHPQSALIVAYISIVYHFFLRLTMGQVSGGKVAGSKVAGSKVASGRVAEETLDSPRNTQHATRFPLPASRFPLTALRSTLHAALFLTTGLALAAIQFIPAVEYTLLSVRAAGIYDKMSGGFPITDVIQVLLPGQVSFYSPLYVGVVGLILAVWVTFAAPNRQTTFWASVAFIALLISFGGNTFLYSPLYLFTPGFSIFRGQERWAFAVAFSLSVLAGYGFKALVCQVAGSRVAGGRVAGSKVAGSRVAEETLDSPRNTQHATRNTFHVSRLTQYLLFFALLLIFLFFYGLNDTGWTPDSPFYGLLNAATLLTLLLVLAWLLWKFASHLPLTLFTVFTAALICLDLFTVNWQTNLYPERPEWHTQMPAAVAAIKQDAAESPDEPYRVYNEFRLYDNYGLPFEIEDLWGASPLRPDRYDKFLAPPMPIERTWELLNVKYVITWRQELYVPSTIIHQEPAGDDTTYVHRLHEVGPRAWLVSRAEIAADPTILQKIADPTFDRWQIALLEPGAEPFVERIRESTNGEYPTGHRSANGELANDESTRNTQHATRFIHPSPFTLHVTTPTPALLILSEPYYPGWQAIVDGQPAALLRADYILRAVPVPAGEHTVELTFRPLTFIIGAVISVVAVLIITAMFILQRVKREPTEQRT